MSDPYLDPFLRLYGIIGHPLAHSLSPLIHNHSFRQNGLPYAYLRWELPSTDLAVFMAALKSMRIHGLSVTIPHKQAVMNYLDEIDSRARRIGAVNTVVLQDGMLHGYNTDVVGFMDPLKKKCNEGLEGPALVLGAGGAARGALAGLQDLGVERIGISNRTWDRARCLAEEFQVDAVPWEQRLDYYPQVVINATPLGMSGNSEQMTPWPEQGFKPTMIAYDMVYNPLETVFLREAGRSGCTVIDGLAMFVGQAAEQFRLWTGREMDSETIRGLVMKALYKTG